MPAEPSRCAVCAAATLAEIEGFRPLFRVTSDCLPFRAGGRLSVCAGCGTIQKPPDEAWFRDIGEIYGRYAIYHQSGGVEQSVFDAVTGQPRRRSEVLAARLASALPPAPGRRVLDIGCGNGAMLLALSAAGPPGRLYGFDLDDRNLGGLQAIPGFAGLYTGAVEDIPGPFDLVTLIHSLEHMPAPRTTLDTVHRVLGLGGRLFIQVPDIAQNPFDLVVADHLCHFSAATLARLIGEAGFAIDVLSAEWVKKELSLLARPLAGAPGAASAADGAVARVRERIGWLQALVDEARAVARAGVRFGIFGTSISATWLFQHLPEAVEFFVDEDPARREGTHLGRPIRPPAEVPAGAVVYLALIPAIATAVHERLCGLPIDLRLPPPLAA
jgi:2-polyprenyl-3-methyl-5-hydroxy-6-metoxy-1,4-benzoquinol methylase